MDDACAICNRDEAAHHEFVPHRRLSFVCVCPGWGDRDVPLVCVAYKGDGVEFCKVCEHGPECHSKVAELEREAGK